MKTQYFTKVENKYVFNVSLIFWHLFIALSSLAIVVSLVVFLWSVIPSSQKEVEKQPYPEKRQYPPPVQVAFNELQLEEAKQEEAPPVAVEHAQEAKVVIQQPVEDTRGKNQYDSSLNILKSLIPPERYSWNGSGNWYYPNGERYYNFYKNEKFRRWIATEVGIVDKLNSAYRKANAGNYLEKKQTLDSYISIVKLLSEEKRHNALQYLIDQSNIADNISQNVNICLSIAKVVSKMPQNENPYYINYLARFGKKNPNDGISFIDYTASIIEKFDAAQRATIIDRITNAYYNYFNQNLSRQKEATDLFVALVPKIKPELLPNAIYQYYGLYINKNLQREQQIMQIDNEHQQSINEIENQFNSAQVKSQMEYLAKQKTKQEFRLKALMGIGGGIILIVLIATILVFLSIQRSVRKIEEKIAA